MPTPLYTKCTHDKDPACRGMQLSMEELTEGISRAIKRWKRITKGVVQSCGGPSECQARGEGEGRWGCAARVRCGKSQALHTVVETGMGRHGGVVCAARGVRGHHLVCGVYITCIPPCFPTPRR